jgi:hypothetical protein
MTQITPRKPLVRMFGLPSWHHHHSSKLSIVGFDNLNSAESKMLILKSNVVDIRIHPDSSQKGWVVEYEICHSIDSWNKGRVWMSTDNLKTAFGLSDECEEMWGQTILIEHGGDVAYQGMYIRYGRYLNIPGPGTGHDGDANISICVNNEIKGAVELLLQ